MICYSVNLLSPFGDTLGEVVKLSVHFLVKNNNVSIFCGKKH